MKTGKESLGRLTFLAEGAFGVVYRADDFQLPGDRAPLAYKEFTREQARQAVSAEKVVAFRDGLSSAERAELDSCSAWPRALVTEASGAVCGLLMPLIPAEFFCQAPDVKTGKLTSQPREMSWMIASTGQRQAAQVDIPDIGRLERLYLLSELVYAIAWLRRRGWVFGDISFRNVAFALAPSRVLLLDCDGAAALADTGREQASTPFWEPPECSGTTPQQTMQDNKTDVYKLGLAILRCLTPGRGASNTRDVARLVGELDADGTGLVDRALSTTRRLRPTAKELYLHLRRMVLASITPPEVMAQLATPFCVRGQDARIEWVITNATRITLQVGYHRTFDLDPLQHPRGYVFRPDESGHVSVAAANQFGTVTVGLGELTLYELPAFHVDMGILPRLELPDLAAFSVPAAAAALAVRPATPVGITDVPGLPPLPTARFTESPLPMTWLPPPWPRIDAGLGGAWHVVSDLLTTEADGQLARLRQIVQEKLAETDVPR